MIGGSLCTGSGGLDLGLERSLGVRWAWHAEIDEAASQILDARWPGVPNLGDFTTVDWDTVERVDVLAAGFPCPDYSLAGRRKGIDGEHGQVWHSVASCLRALRPAVVILENVDGIRTAPGPVGGDAGESALGVVLADLAELGYRWAYDRLRAADVGAPHGRLRWFCVAALPSAAVAFRDGVDADGRVRGRGEGASGSRGSAPSALASRPEVDVAEDALADGPGAAADAERERLDGRGVGDEEAPAGGGIDRGAVAARPAAPARLLPTPVVTDSFGSRRSTARTDEWKSNPGTSLTDAIWETQGRETDTRGEPLPGSEAVRLLPTPQAADGDGGRQEKSAMGNAGQRPSGQKATLPLPTAVGMREELSETPFSQPTGDDGQLVLLPTPVANPENPGAGGELRAALVHGEGRRNETGIDTFGRPNDGRPSKLLPTPVAEDASSRGRQTNADGTANDSEAAKRSGAHTLTDIARLHPSPLLPTPTAQDAANTAGPSQRERHSDPLNVVAADLGTAPCGCPWDDNVDAGGYCCCCGAHLDDPDGMYAIQKNAKHGLSRCPLYGQEVAVEPKLLPTPQAADGERSSEQGPRYYATGGDNPTLLGAARRSNIEWGVYEPAVRRWEEVFGEAAPVPTDEKGRLAPDFVRWMLGYPPGWFDVDGVSRTKKLRALGNSVQVQCAEAVGHWTRALIKSGLLLSAP